jgi:hypothetical protein
MHPVSVGVHVFLERIRPVIVDIFMREQFETLESKSRIFCVFFLIFEQSDGDALNPVNLERLRVLELGGSCWLFGFLLIFKQSHRDALNPVDLERLRVL